MRDTKTVIKKMRTAIKKMLIGAAVLSASANANAYDFEADGMFYNILFQDDKTVEVTYRDTEFDSYSGDVVIPERVAYNNETYRVTSIGYLAFLNCGELISIEIPNSITSINEAFYGCESLTAVYISDLSAWMNIDIEDSTSGIYSPLEYAHNLYLNGELMTDLVIPDGTAEIKDHAFTRGECFKSVTIPSSVTSIGDSAFSGCFNLTAVNISELSAWMNIDFTNPASNPLLPGNHNLYLNGELVTDLVIPDGIAEIKDNVFYGGNFKSATIPYSVASIGESAFADCTNLTSIEMPNSITSIGTAAFANCTGLASVEMPGNVTFLGASVFAGCTKLVSVIIPNSITSISTNIFYNCSSLTSITLPESVTEIFYGVFNGCTSLTEINSLNPIPPTISSTTTFDPQHYTTATLNIPEGSLSAYQSADVWKDFQNIQETDFSGVGEVTDTGISVTAVSGNIVIRGADNALIAVYNTNGQLVYSGTETTVGDLDSGIYIVSVGGQIFKVWL